MEPIKFTANNFDKETKTITVPCPHDVYMANMKSLNDTTRLLPFVEVVGSKGVIKKFGNAARSFNHLIYECDGVTLKLKM